MYLVIGDHLGTTAVWYNVSLECIILVIMQFLVVAERGAVGYDCRDHCRWYGSGGVILNLGKVSYVPSITMATVSLSLDTPSTLLQPI